MARGRGATLRSQSGHYTSLLCIKIRNRIGDKAQPWQSPVATENALDLLLGDRAFPPVTQGPDGLEHSLSTLYTLIHKIYPKVLERSDISCQLTHW